MKLPRKLRALFSKERLDAEMSEEMGVHLELQAQENLARGMSPDEAHYAAQRAFGGEEQLKERCRDQRSWPWLEDFFQDARQTSRSLRKNRSFAIATVLTVGLGIGLVTVQFSFINGTLIHGPFADSARVLEVSRMDASGNPGLPLPLADFEAWQREQKAFSAMGAYETEELEIRSANSFPRRYRSAAISANVTEIARARPLLGRSFSVADEMPGAPRVLLLGEQVWARDFGRDPQIVGRAVWVRGESATIVGVMPAEFSFPVFHEMWANLRRPSVPSGSAASDGVRVVGRLRDGVTVAAARAELDLLAERAKRGRADSSGQDGRVYAEPFGESDIGRGMRVVLGALSAMVAGLLALACVNVANLLFARSLARAHALAVQTALGATRGRIVRQLVCESLLLTSAGAAVGCLCAWWSIPAINRQFLSDANFPSWVRVELDYRVLAVTAALSLGIGILCGLVPAWRATGRRANLMAKVGGAIVDRTLSRSSRVIVIAEIAVATALLLATAAFVQRTLAAGRIKFPFVAERTLTARVTLDDSRVFPDDVGRQQFYRSLLEQARSLPGVSAATLTSRHPAETGIGGPVEAQGKPATWNSAVWGIGESVAAGFFHDLNVPLRAGREFSPSEAGTNDAVAIVNESLARRLWPDEWPLGKQFRELSLVPGQSNSWLTVIGVVGDLPMRGVNLVTRPSVGYYLPFGQKTPRSAVLLLTTTGDPSQLIRPLRALVQALSPELAVEEIKTVDARVAESLAAFRTIGALAFAFGVAALFMAATGIYAISAFVTQQRMREFGIRIALGATSGGLLRLVFKQAAGRLAIGLTFGAAAGWAFSRVLAANAGRLAGNLEMSQFAVVGGTVVASVIMAVWVPARRVTRIDPLVALRAE